VSCLLGLHMHLKFKLLTHHTIYCSVFVMHIIFYVALFRSPSGAFVPVGDLDVNLLRFICLIKHLVSCCILCTWRAVEAVKVFFRKIPCTY